MNNVKDERTKIEKRLKRMCESVMRLKAEGDLPVSRDCWRNGTREKLNDCFSGKIPCFHDVDEYHLVRFAS